MVYIYNNEKHYVETLINHSEQILYEIRSELYSNVTKFVPLIKNQSGHEIR